MLRRISSVVFLGENKRSRWQRTMQLDYTWLSGTSDVGCHGNSFIIGIWDLRYNSLEERVPIGGKHIRQTKPQKLLMELARLPACVGGILANEVVKRSLSQHCPA